VALTGGSGNTCSQSAPWPMVSEHALPSAPKSADRIDGAMMAGGDMASGSAVDAAGASVRDLV
jgi:hypothetical protein